MTLNEFSEIASIARKVKAELISKQQADGSAH
jgi:hypothetical protein